LIRLRAFQRGQMSGSQAALGRTLWGDYAGQAWTELYKVIMDLDVIASPLQLGRKLLRGLREFVLFPVESLVFDDTPGAFLYGALRGLQSLLVNSSDVIFTLFMKLCGTIAWLLQQATLDPAYQEESEQRAKRHPSGIWEGFVGALVELGRGFYHALSGLVLLPYQGARAEGALGLAKGVGRALLGLPLKPLASVFELQRVLYDGLLHALGRGVHIDERWHELQTRPLSQRYAELFRTWELSDHLHAAMVRVVARDSRVKQRYLALSLEQRRLLLFNVRKLHRTSYEPRTVPFARLTKVVRPVVPETTFLLIIKEGGDGDGGALQIVAPDRELFIEALYQAGVSVEDVDKSYWRLHQHLGSI